MRLRRLLFGGEKTPEEEAEIDAEIERKRKEEEERKRKAEGTQVKKRGYEGYFGEGKKRGKILEQIDEE